MEYENQLAAAQGKLHAAELAAESATVRLAAAEKEVAERERQLEALQVI